MDIYDDDDDDGGDIMNANKGIVLRDESPLY